MPAENGHSLTKPGFFSPSRSVFAAIVANVISGVVAGLVVGGLSIGAISYRLDDLAATQSEHQIKLQEAERERQAIELAMERRISKAIIGSADIRERVARIEASLQSQGKQVQEMVNILRGAWIPHENSVRQWDKE